MKRVAAGILFFIFVMVSLTFTHSFWLQLRYAIKPAAYWVNIYCLMAAIVTFIAAVFAPLFTKVAAPNLRPGLASVVVGLLTSLPLGLYAHWVGAILSAQEVTNLLLHDLNHFFRNFKSITFVFVNTPLYGLAAGLLHFYLESKKSAPVPATKQQ